ncbi:MAG TPA: glycosyltransferase family 4 protein [Fimbriimonas sp.]
MRVALIVAGAGPMYCGACSRDVAMSRLLSSLGHEVSIYPVYTPLKLEDGDGLPLRPLSFGGIGAYLRDTIGWSWSWLDHPRLVQWATGFAIQTHPRDLARMTVSVLKGTNGRHGREMERTAHLVAESSPDVVILPNSMLACMAPALKRQTKARIVCQVQGEDGFIEELPEPWRSEAISLIRKAAPSVDGFVAPSKGYSERMRAFLEIDACSVVAHPVVPDLLPSPLESPLTIGCLSSIRRAKGLDRLVEAMRFLPEMRLLVAGRTLEPAFEQQVRATAPPNVQFLGELSPSQKREFYGRCDLVCLPSRLHESRAIAALEALSHGRPVVASAQGFFTELATFTPAVVTVDAEDPRLLSEAILNLADRPKLSWLGREGCESLCMRFSPHRIGIELNRLLQAESTAVASSGDRA